MQNYADSAQCPVAGHESKRHNKTTSHQDSYSFEYEIFTRQFIITS